MAVAKVQAAGNNSAFTTGLVVTLGSTPTAGNILVAGAAFGTGHTYTKPSGTWTTVDDILDVGRGDRILTSWHLVVGGDGTTWTFGIDSNDSIAAIVYEISGANTTTPIDKHTTATPRDSTTLAATTTAAPTAASCLGVCIIGAGLGTSNSQSVSGVTTGWTNDINASANFHSAFGAVKNTTTSSAEAFTWTLAQSDSGAVSLMLIAPSGGGGGSRGLFMTPPVSGVGVGGSFFRDPLQGAAR